MSLLPACFFFSSLKLQSSLIYILGRELRVSSLVLLQFLYRFRSSVYYSENRVWNFISLAFTRTDTFCDPSGGNSDNNVFEWDTVSPGDTSRYTEGTGIFCNINILWFKTVRSQIQTDISSHSHIVTILSQKNPIRNSILSSHLCLDFMNCFLRSDCATKIMYTILVSPVYEINERK
jgi:hypothetical protein